MDVQTLIDDAVQAGATEYNKGRSILNPADDARIAELNACAHELFTGLHHLRSHGVGYSLEPIISPTSTRNAEKNGGSQIHGLIVFTNVASTYGKGSDEIKGHLAVEITDGKMDLGIATGMAGCAVLLHKATLNTPEARTEATRHILTSIANRFGANGFAQPK